MKRGICFLLAVLFCMSLCACSPKQVQQESASGFRVGFGRVNITPTNSVRLVGYFNYDERYSEGVMDPLYATCIAITDAQNNTVLIYTLDLIGTQASDLDLLRGYVEEELGVPGENLIASGTHTHSAPIYADIPNFIPSLLQAAKDAMDDRAPAQLYAGQAEIPGMNFVRHYVLNDDTIGGDNFGKITLHNVVRHTTDADRQMQLLRFVRQEGKQDIVMVNWQAHPKLSSSSVAPGGKESTRMISADFIGYCRMYMESNADCLFAYYTGASGNLNPVSLLSEENIAVRRQVNLYGEDLAKHILSALEHLTPMQQGAVRTLRVNYQAKAAAGTPFQLELSAVAVGNIGFVTLPFETFDTTGMEIKDASPFDYTFILTCAGGKHGYMPPDYVWDYNPDGDTPYEVEYCQFVRGTAEQVAAKLTDMLNELK